MTATQITPTQLELTSKTIAMLAVDAVEKANSGHPGMPMGMADLAAVLWLKHLKFNPKDPAWVNRDRFVLSNGHGSMLLYSLLHLAGYDLSMQDLQSFRQWESKTPGHPEAGMTPGVECTTGPLGQGISNAVGMAIGQKLLASRYNSEQQKIIDHRIFVFAGDGCLMEGVSSEASSVAGHLGLGNLKVIYDDNHISIAGHTELAFTEDVCKRYEAYGWYVQRVDGHNHQAIDQAINNALKETERPSLIAARTIIGKGSPNKADSHDVHGSPLGKAEIELTKKALNWPLEPTFFIPEEVKNIFQLRVAELTEEYQGWKEKFASWEGANPELAARFKKQVQRQTPADLTQKLVAAIPTDGKPISTRKLSELVIQAASKEVDSLIGGSADLEPSTLTLIKGSTDVERSEFKGKNLRFGVREHGMGAIMNGLSYYGSFIPYGSTFLVFSDYMRPPIRLAALSHLRGLFIFTHDSVFLGEDGPTHQPIEHLNSLRMIHNLWVLRPADALETAVCYSLAIGRKHGPCLFAFTRQNLDQIERPADFSPSIVEKGGYTAFAAGKSPSKPELIFIATGSEVSLAISAAKTLSSELSVRVVSMPCWELFKEQSVEYRQALIPRGVNKVTIEAGATFGWLDLINSGPEETLRIGIDHFGASAPASVIAEKLGLTPEAVCAKVRERFLA